MVSVYLLGYFDYASSRLRGSVIAEALIQNGYSSRYRLIQNDEPSAIFIHSLHDAIVIILKSHTDEHNFCQAITQDVSVIKRPECNNLVLHDLIDSYCDASTNLVDNFVFESQFDAVIVNSKYMRHQMMKLGYRGERIYVIYHAWDPNIIQSELTTLGSATVPLVYRGCKQKCTANLTELEIPLLAWSPQIPREVQFAWVEPLSDQDINLLISHTSTKLATTVASQSILILNRIPIFVELLGDNYPFFLDSLDNLDSSVSLAQSILTNLNQYRQFFAKWYQPLIKYLSPNPKCNVSMYISCFHDLMRRHNKL
jgi:hypothetical protein